MTLIHPSEFRARWTAWYPRVDPFGYALSTPFHERWLRVHSLPDGRRYPEHHADWQELLTRHNAVATAMIAGSPAVLIGYDYEGRYSLPPDHPLAEWLPCDGPVMRVIRDDDGDATSLFAAPIAWRPGMLDGPLALVAEDALRLMLLNWGTGAVYAPYDGGADLYFPSAADRDLARGRFGAWRSPDPSGL